MHSANTLPGTDNGTDHELPVVKLRDKLRNVKKYLKTQTRYDLENVSKQYAIKVKKKNFFKRFAELDLVNRMPDELWEEVGDIVKEEAKNNIPKASRKKKAK